MLVNSETLARVRDKMLENPVLDQQARSNTKEQFALGDFRKAMMGAVVAGVTPQNSVEEGLTGRTQ